MLPDDYDDRPPYMEVEQFEAAWRELTDQERSVAEFLLEAASEMLRGRVDNLDHRIDTGQVRKKLVALAVFQIVKRVMMNPEAARQRSRTAGPFTESITIDSAVSAGALYVSDADLAMFMPVSTWSPIGSAHLRAGIG